ncbi:VOC family protein [Amycolatopsis sp., V23-08]|uniref:VOC family protein n=1 Tax=Amycolatopsis heterodermiae TaxID=3110235 RepID=A0ABU5R3A1_9PSEU|nr:VOC family protein [Amycolatopsis sp., V23-08]MEA5360673.1 VOC family protein [Amycolatopsis sp., V23-08]
MTDMKLEIAVLPVSDVDRAKAFYKALGWREDADFPGEGGFRVIQLTPPGSPTSVIFGSRITDAAPGSAQGLHLVVTDIEAARAEIAAQGVAISEVFHDAGGVFHHAGTEGRVSGPDPDHASYASFASFSDPDGNGWVLQEITTRLPGRVTDVTFSSAAELADALRHAAAAHGEHEKQLGHEDADWPSWYAEYMVQHGRAGA